MTDTPTVTVNVDGSSFETEHVYTHLNEFDREDITRTGPKDFHLYVFEGEDLEGELKTTLDVLREDYIFATGVVWPDWIKEEIEDFGVEMMEALEWVIAMGEKPEPEDVEVIRDHL